MITAYFSDNNACQVTILQVSDAFNIGGPLAMTPATRKGSGGAVLERGVCSTYDFVSAFRQTVLWDPDQAIQGSLMCDIPNS